MPPATTVYCLPVAAYCAAYNIQNNSTVAKRKTGWMEIRYRYFVGVIPAPALLLCTLRVQLTAPGYSTQNK
jgi:hypothetical protein